MSRTDIPVATTLVWGLEGQFSEPRVVQPRDAIYLEGWCFHAEHSIRRLEILVGGVAHPVSQHGLTRLDVLHEQVRLGHDPSGNSLFSGFWVMVPLVCPEGRHRVACEIRATLSNGRTVTAPIGALDLTSTTHRPQPPDAAEPLVAICMATYNPPLEMLAEQVESLLAQTHQNWICIINDDSSAPSPFAEIERLAVRDVRFKVERNSRRLGYYRNFERCLLRVPSAAHYVAFCDQDDLWYPEKLATSLAAFEPDVTLVYCDMHIVDHDGKRLADTYWTARRNNFTDLSALIFANTVTGAASVFRVDLLDHTLPFPEAIEGSHDHWVACVALAKGRIAYIERALYAYRQHGSNALGRYVGQPKRPIASRILSRLRSGSSLIHSLQTRLLGYRILIRTAVIARTLEARFAGQPLGNKMSIISRLASMEHSLWPVVTEAARAKLHDRPTLGIEWLCLQGAIGTKLAKAYYRLKRRQIMAQAMVNVRTSATPVIASTPAPEAWDGAPSSCSERPRLSSSRSDVAPRSE